MSTLKQSEEERRPRGRPSSFDRDKLVEEIMHLFWERGYKDLSFNEIAQETGLTRASLYNAFESKEALLLEALRHYFTLSPDASLSELENGGAVGPAFYKVFDTACQMWASDRKHRGCMGVNCLNELMNDGSELGDTLKCIYGEQQVFIVDLIRRAVKQKELPVSTDPDVTGSMIIAFMAGFSTFSKNGASEKELKGMCHAFLENIGFEKT